MYVPKFLRDSEAQHNLGYWVETREDAMKEAYYMVNWYSWQDETEKEKGFEVMVNLARDIDLPKKEYYVDPKFTRSS